MMATRRLGLAVLFAVAGCSLPTTPGTDGGATDGGGSVDAGAGPCSLSGQLAFPDAGAFEAHVIDKNNGATIGYAFLLENHGFTCPQLESLNGGPVPATFTQLIGEVFAPSEGAGVATGSYQVVAQQGFGTAFVSYAHHFPDGGSDGPFVASDGVVTLTTATDNELAGTFQATIQDGTGLTSELTGSFDAPFCP